MDDTALLRRLAALERRLTEGLSSIGEENLREDLLAKITAAAVPVTVPRETDLTGLRLELSAEDGQLRVTLYKGKRLLCSGETALPG